ncbi:MAG: S-methyl-5-thioribose-1-phosphate isomerase [Candidatus Atribacteria bacterium]|nr:S-methyl-5-thioribose-1-phosphate isomerase [Candidatus Atribacteria bacterium]
MKLKTIEWNERTVTFLDQTRLPGEQVYCTTGDFRVVAEGIRSLRLRGAPLIGVSAAYGICLGAMESMEKGKTEFYRNLEAIDALLRSTRPTAVNLFWALDRMKKIWSTCRDRNRTLEEGGQLLIEEAKKIENEDRETNEQIARHGSRIIRDGDRILTHCNAGALACSAWGTALGVIYWAVEKDRKTISVYADETRPLLQGARLTSFELQKNGIPVTVITDSMAGSLMAYGMVDKVIVGADRIALNGDVANKIGTFSVAVLAHYHSIPFYIAAPLSTVDPVIRKGSDIPIEERNPEEVTSWKGDRIVPEGVTVWNPAFDVTPHDLIRGIITEKGILYSPFEEKLENLKQV